MQSKLYATFEEFVFGLLRDEPRAIPFSKSLGHVMIHGHCHAKALTDINSMLTLSEFLPETSVNFLETGCCGMAGAFGMMEDKYEISLAVAKSLIDQIDALPESTHVVASGTSCRHQIGHLAKAHPFHMAEIMAMAL